MTCQHLRVGLMAMLPAPAGPVEKARDAVDPDCTVAKAARGAATKAAVGVRGKKKDDDGPLEKLRDD